MHVKSVMCVTLLNKWLIINLKTDIIDQKGKNMGTSIIADKSYQFAKDIVDAYEFLVAKKEYVMSKQLLKAGTSIAANMQEAKYAQSKKDFLSKSNIALKEAGETEFWIRLLIDKKYLSEQHQSLYQDCIEIKKILHSIVKTTKETLKN